MIAAGPEGSQRLRTGYLRLRAALRDPVTGLYALAVHHDEVRALLADEHRAGVLWIGLAEGPALEAVYGWEAYDRLLATAAEALLDLRGGLGASVLAQPAVHDDGFALFLGAEPRSDEPDTARLARLAAAAERAVTAAIRPALPADFATARPVRVGAARLVDQPFQRFERCVHAAVAAARADAERQAGADQLENLAELHRILREAALTIRFQPVVELATGATVGLEAFAGGPAESRLAAPRALFAAARDGGCASDLDRLAHAAAVDALAASGRRPERLFLNCSAEYLVRPEWRETRWLDRLRAAGLAPAQVVLETAEGQFAADPAAYRAALEPLRAQGYRLSFDDVGSGARTLALLEALRPDVVKFDLTLARGLEDDPLRRELVASLARLAARAGAHLAIERIETAAEHAALRTAGASWGQGQLFGAAAPLPAAEPIP